ncbi:MAG: hypothetical protein IKH41_01365 [Clostridia bacterium]|nr:hypothetical protein [Clostridia bacterium]
MPIEHIKVGTRLLFYLSSGTGARDRFGRSGTGARDRFVRSGTGARDRFGRRASGLTHEKLDKGTAIMYMLHTGDTNDKAIF